MNLAAKTATGANRETIRVGMTVRLWIVGAQLPEGGNEPDRFGPTVTVTRIHKQGYDGTILTTDPAPNPDYPHHFSGRANRFHAVSR